MLASEPPKYTADVDIRLLVNGLVLRVAQVCRELIVLRDHAEIAAGGGGAIGGDGKRPG